ncbi:MAG: AAA family ATPase [DPANN group archaeon]|nr:AAA family ATPase [DPANN group archaeon]
MKDTTVLRKKSGVTGFDELIEGGFPENSVILLSGTCGTGKTIFGLQYLINGTENGERGLYLSLEEPESRIIRDAELFGWDMDTMTKDKGLLIKRSEIEDWQNFVAELEDIIKSNKITRIVVDSISLLATYFRDKYDARRNVFELIELLKSLNTTAILISEVDEEHLGLSNQGIAEFITDGVVVLYYWKQRDHYLRGISVRKMRSTDHSQRIHPLKIKKSKGVQVFPGEELFGEA